MLNTLLKTVSKGYMSVPQAATLVNLTSVTVRKLCDRGDIRAIKIGTRYRIYTEEIQRFLTEGNAKTKND